MVKELHLVLVCLQITDVPVRKYLRATRTMLKNVFQALDTSVLFLSTIYASCFLRRKLVIFILVLDRQSDMTNTYTIKLEELLINHKPYHDPDANAA